MEIGNEISQKIRSAIKAKLVDLGAYVDDELPDYIMVMVANKKTKEQMTEDLNLFLGTHTDKFTSWLHALLCKLQTITADVSDGGTAEQDHGEPTPEETDLLRSADAAKAKAKVTDQGKAPTEQHQQSVEASASESLDDKGAEKSHTKSTRTAARTKSHDKPQEQHAGLKRAEKASEQRLTNQMTDEVIHLRPEHDEFEEEIPPDKQLPAKSKPRTTSSSETHRTRRKSSTEYRSRESHRTHRAPYSSSHRSHEERRDKSRALSSLVGAVISHQHSDDDEDGPQHPVASVVHVTERKSSIPEKMQANKSLLLKAMKDAQQSVEVAKHKHAAKHDDSGKATHSRAADYGEASSNGELMSVMERRQRYQKSVRSRLGLIRHESADAKIRERTAVTTRRREREREGQRSRDRSGHAKSREGEKRDSHRRSPDSTRHASVERDRRDSDRATHDRDRTDTGETSLDLKSRKEHLGDEYVIDGNAAETEYIPTRIKDTRNVEVIIAGGQKDTTAVDFQMHSSDDDQQPRSRSFERPREQRSHEWPMRRSSERSRRRLYEDRARTRSRSPRVPRRERSRSTESKYISQSVHKYQDRAGPQFVVTLEGVDPARLRSEALQDEPMQVSDEDNLDLTMTLLSPARDHKVTVHQQRSTVNPVMISLSDDELEPAAEQEVTSSTVESSEVSMLPATGQRCRFYPNCLTGDQCPYVHPSIPCVKFPNCHFGNRCLYVHPPCKFDASCQRVDCPFSHTVKRAPVPQPTMPLVLQPIKMGVYVPPISSRFPPPVTQSAPQQQNCRFYPNCTNMDCTFRHPKHCRFGISCNNKSRCHFFHPPLPTADKLKWTGGTSSSTSAVK